MSGTDLKAVVDRVLRRAQQQGFVVARDLREELAQAGLSEKLWNDVLEKIRPLVQYRHGRYYHVPSVPVRIQSRMRKGRNQQRQIHRAVRQLIRRYKAASTEVERREHGRTHFIRTVRASATNSREFTLLARDISLSGIRLLSGQSLLGQQLRVRIPRDEDSSEVHCFLVRILWSAVVADGIHDNGGVFMDISETERTALKIATED